MIAVNDYESLDKMLSILAKLLYQRSYWYYRMWGMTTGTMISYCETWSVTHGTMERHIRILSGRC